MKKPMISRAHMLVFAAALLAAPLAGYAGPAKATNAAPQENIQSTFVMPKSPAEGRDPFFPRATSLYQMDTPRQVVVEPGINLLKLNGILGSSLAQVNNVTLSVGETEEVKTTSGPVSVRLVEIHPADGSVVVEASGQRRILKFAAR